MDRQQRAVAVGTEKVVEIWEAMNDGYPYFAVFFNRNNKYFQFNKDDLDAAKAFLTTNLGILEDNNDNSMYYLNIYPEAKTNYPNSGMICSFPFRLNEFKAGSEIAGASSNGDFVKALKEAHEKQIELVTKLAEANAANQPLDWFDRINVILENPGAANALVPLLQPVINGLMNIAGKISGVPMTAPQVPANFAYPPGIAGPQNNTVTMNETEKELLLDQALDRLEKHGDLLEMLTALADYADKNPTLFKGYLQMLMGK